MQLEVIKEFSASENGFTVIRYRKGMQEIPPNTAMTALTEGWAVRPKSKGGAPLNKALEVPLDRAAGEPSQSAPAVQVLPASKSATRKRGVLSLRSMTAGG